LRCSIIIPSYQRGVVLLDSLDELQKLPDRAEEIIVVDQTPKHPQIVESKLRSLEDAGVIRWLKQKEPSIPKAMNYGLSHARGDFVLFLDDDIRPDSGLVAAHRAAQSRELLVAGMVLQPEQVPVRLQPGEPFRFNSDTPARIEEFMGGNFSVRKDVALALGGFDENFVGAAYRFEAEFAHRFVARYGSIAYEPRAVIHHLAIPSGGTRAHGHHLRTVRPTHSVGAYYFLLVTRRPGWIWDLLWRLPRSVRTRHHLRRPWWIPMTLLAEIRGLFWALSLCRRGQQLLPSLRPATAVSSERDG
jgi:glycosyltransferase involved in cell wall biosynthesis